MRKIAIAAFAATLLAGPGLAAALGPADVAALLAASQTVASEGVAGPDLSTAAARALSLDPTEKADGQAALAAQAAQLAALSRGRLARPASVEAEWALKSPYDAEADFAAAQREGRIGAWANALQPQGPGYRRLATLRRTYATIVAAGGWVAIGAGPAVAPGRADPRLPTLRVRLSTEGYDTRNSAAGSGAVAAPLGPTVLDAGLAQALRAYQANNGLAQTGALDQATVAALDVTATDRLAQIDLNLERERWMPAHPPADRIEVDIAGQTLTLYRAGLPVLAMKVIVGQPSRRTPMFASALDGVVFNPPWVVPRSIAVEELYPRERRQPGYLARHGFSVIGGQLVQAAGPSSSLGLLKFEMPSPFGVYLHDTPARTLFARPQRALSHGCIRLEAPRALAVILLGAQGWTSADIDRATDARVTRRLALSAHTPVFVVYRTVSADPAGRLQTRPDVYGWDARLAQALAAR